MFIYCPRDLRDIYYENKLLYSNRIINLEHVGVIGTTTVKREGLPTFHTIRFSHDKNHSTEWYFVTKEDRDNIFDLIIERHVNIIRSTAVS